MILISAGHKINSRVFLWLYLAAILASAAIPFISTILRYLAGYGPELGSESRYTSGTFALVLMIVRGGPVSRSFNCTHGCSLDMVPFVQSHHLAEAL